MDINRFTEKAQEALQNAQRLAARGGQQYVEVEHLLAALLDQERPGAGNDCDIEAEKKAAERDETLSQVVRRALRDYVSEPRGRARLTPKTNSNRKRA